MACSIVKITVPLHTVVKTYEKFPYDLLILFKVIFLLRKFMSNMVGMNKAILETPME